MMRIESPGEILDSSRLIVTRAEFRELAESRPRIRSAPMDRDTLVTERTESGERLISALAADGFETRVAFWAKPTEEGK
jgi:hypothetical protein